MTRSNFGRRYFSRPPHKSLYFWGGIVWQVFIVSMVLLLAGRLHDRLDVEGLGGGLWWMSLSVAASIIFWLRIWKSHSRLYQINLKNSSSSYKEQTDLDTVLTQSASLEIAGLCVTLFVLQSFVIGFMEVVGK